MKSVVVIDDDIDVRDVIVFALQSDGFEVVSYSNGKLGLEGLLKTPPEALPGLIIVDYLMPEMDGLTFINEICLKHKNILGKIPIAISSAMGTTAPEINCDNELIHLHKPMDLDDLLSVARKYCS